MLSSQLQGWFKEGTVFILIVDPLWDLARTGTGWKLKQKLIVEAERACG